MSQPETLIHPWENPEHFAAENYAIHVEKAAESFPSAASLKLERTRGTIVRFIFWTHVPENQDQVTPLLEGCDILALELANHYVYENTSERQRAHGAQRTALNILSILVTGSVDPKTDRRLRKHGILAEEVVNLTEEERKADIQSMVQYLMPDNTYERILTHGMDRLEKIAFLDTEIKDSQHLNTLILAAERGIEGFSAAITGSGASWEDLREYALIYLRSSAIEHQFREGITTKQLERLVRDNPGKSIAVLYGIGHQTLTRQLQIPSVSLQRQFTPSNKYIEPIARKSADLKFTLTDSLKSGIYNTTHLDQYMAIWMSAKLLDMKSFLALNPLSSTQLTGLSHQLAELWKEPVDQCSTDSHQERIIKRQTQTIALLKGLEGVDGQSSDA